MALLKELNLLYNMTTPKQKILFSKEECDLILKKYELKPIDGNQIRKSSISYTYKNMNDVEDKGILDRFILWINEEFNISIDWENTDSKEFYLQTYVKGDKFNRHNDSIHNRLYGLGLLLNDDFEGGEFIIENITNNTEIFNFQKIIGNCYFFESIFEHELYEIKEGIRNIILVFFRKSQIKNGKLKII